MSNASERIKEKMNNMSYEELNKKTKSQTKSEKRSFGKIIFEFLTWRFRVIPAILGYDDKDVKEPTSARRGQVSHGGRPVTPPNSGREFREGYHFDPEKWVVKEMQAEAYHDLVDGKGDHDCGHEH